MRKTKAELEREYDQLYEEADELLKKYDPCDVVNGECAAYRAKFYTTNFCCDGCRHLSSKGCRVKSLACKLWLCPIAQNNLPRDIIDKFVALRRKSVLSHIAVFRGSKALSIRNARNYPFPVER